MEQARKRLRLVVGYIEGAISICELNHVELNIGKCCNVTAEVIGEFTARAPTKRIRIDCREMKDLIFTPLAGSYVYIRMMKMGHWSLLYSEYPRST